MSVNSTNQYQQPFAFFILFHESECINFTVGRHVLTTITFTYILLNLPLSVFVLYVGFQRWREQRSVSSAATMTHSDFFNYNMAVMELIGVFGYATYYGSSYADRPDIWVAGYTIRGFGWVGQILFPILICMEYYLAVVYPITYRKLKQADGVRIRNICTGCIWLSCFWWMSCLILLIILNTFSLVLTSFMLMLSLIILVFSCLSVLRVLIRPRPGNVGRARMQVDRSKEKAVRTILIVTGALWLKLAGSAASILIRLSTQMSVKCTGEGSIIVFSLVGSLVLSVLFLQRAGKLPDWQRSTA